MEIKKINSYILKGLPKKYRSFTINVGYCDDKKICWSYVFNMSKGITKIASFDHQQRPPFKQYTEKPNLESFFVVFLQLIAPLLRIRSVVRLIGPLNDLFEGFTDNRKVI